MPIMDEIPSKLIIFRLLSDGVKDVSLEGKEVEKVVRGHRPFSVHNLWCTCLNLEPQLVQESQVLFHRFSRQEVLFVFLEERQLSHHQELRDFGHVAHKPHYRLDPLTADGIFGAGEILNESLLHPVHDLILEEWMSIQADFLVRQAHQNFKQLAHFQAFTTHLRGQVKFDVASSASKTFQEVDGLVSLNEKEAF